MEQPDERRNDEPYKPQGGFTSGFGVLNAHGDVKPVLGAPAPATAGLFTYSAFSSTTATATATSALPAEPETIKAPAAYAMPVFSAASTQPKRPSIDESWVNINWSEQDPPQSSRVEDSQHVSSSEHLLKSDAPPTLAPEQAPNTHQPAAEKAVQQAEALYVDRHPPATPSSIKHKQNAAVTPVRKDNAAMSHDSQEPEEFTETVEKPASAKMTPKARTPRKSAQDTPTTPRSSGRQRKVVDRLSPVTLERHDTKAIEISAGHGTKFADIAHISKELAKRKADYQPVVALHRILFGRPGEAAKRKAHLRQFNGLASEEDSKKALEKLLHMTAGDLLGLCVFLNVDRSGDKKVLAERIAAFLLAPVDLGESKPAPKRTPQKRTKPASKSAKSKVAKKLDHGEADDEDGDVDGRDDDGEEEGEEEDESQGEEEQHGEQEEEEEEKESDSEDDAIQLADLAAPEPAAPLNPSPAHTFAAAAAAPADPKQNVFE